MKNLVTREKRKIVRSMDILWHRRINWRAVTRHRVRYAFEDLVRSARTDQYPISLYVVEHEQPNEGLVQLLAGSNLTGVVNRRTEFDPEKLTLYKDDLVEERGASLVASQSVTGHVHFTVHLYSSDRIRPRKKEILLFRPLDPRDVSNALIKKAIRRFFVVLRSSSVYGISDGVSRLDRASMVWMRMQDIRFKYRLAKSLLSLKNEWGKAIFAALLALLVTLVGAIIVAQLVTQPRAEPNNSFKPKPLRGSA